MHLLIIPGEELNERNQSSSIFELHQAEALNRNELQVGFISVNLRGSIYKEFSHGLRRLKDGLKLKYRTSCQRVLGFNLIESYGLYQTPSFLGFYRNERVKAGLIAFEHYVLVFGKPDIIHAHSRFLDSVLIANKISKKYNVPYIFSEHSSFHQRELVTKSEYKLYVKLINEAKKWIVVSESLGRFITNRITELSLKINKSFIVIPNNLGSYFIQNKYLIVDKSTCQNFTFLNIASLDSNKNHELLLDSFAELSKRSKNVKLKIAGAGNQLGGLQNKINTLGLKNVEFLGQLERNDVVNEIQKAHCFVLSSTIETFGVVLIEAMSLGLPIISTKCGGPNNLVDEQNGILVEPNNINELTNAMVKIMENYDSYNFAEIRSNCIKKYGPNVIGEKLIEIYQGALELG